MGLWLLQRVLKERRITDLPALIAQTEALPACRFLINPNDDRFINPDDMRAEIQAVCRETDQPVPVSDAELARCIFDSLALLYADILHELANLRGENLPNCILSAADAKTRYSTSCAPMHVAFA